MSVELDETSKRAESSNSDKLSLLGCPFCGSDNVHMYGVGASQEPAQVWCKDCYAKTKGAWDYQTAAENWNRRAT